MKSSLAFVALTFLVGMPDQARKEDKPPKILVQNIDYDITGYYVCKGQDSGKPYSGVVVIEQEKDVYIFQWVIRGGATFLGVEVRQGNALAVGWTLPAKDGKLTKGVTLYKIETGRLVGKWATLPGPDTARTETLTFLKKLEKEEDD